ncbi:MAG: ROK family transcriptional regulator [Chloroflexi bacterium]|nr:MAG: ROK family transcriptional regulator [Chloroflexota bacterium]
MALAHGIPENHQRTLVLEQAEAEVVAAIREAGTLSRTDLARQLGYSRSNITSTVQGLLERHIITEVGPGESQGGRRPVMLSLNGKLGYVVGIDLGATSLDMALADFNGHLLERSSEPADVRDAPEKVLGRMTEIALEFLQRRRIQPEQVLGIGVGVPGPVQFSSGLLIAPPLMPRWEAFPIKDFFRDTFPAARVVVDNDVNVMAIGELYAGAGKGIDNFLFIKIGTGIGCGIICKGQIYRGSDGCAGDVGHICIDYNGPVCHCGNVGCLEAMAAGPPIAARAEEAARRGQSEFLAQRLAAKGALTAKDVSEAAATGDQVANQIIKESGRMIGGMLAGLVNFYNPRLILIGGGVSKTGYKLLSAIRQAVLRRSTALSTRDLHIDLSSLGDDAGVVGAIHLALEYVFTVK